MVMKISDYIVKFLTENGITTCFSITGGFSMHLNDSFGNHKNFKVYYNHHEQACGYAAVGYTKTNNKPSVVCTTAGIAATNAISPCLIAYQDSLPVLFISGQVKTYDSIRNINTSNSKLRNYAFADCDIISAVSSITKYAYEINKTSNINEILYNCIYNLISGRPGPVWLSIPLDIQGSLIENMDTPIYTSILDTNIHNLDNVFNLLKLAKRPIILAGGGIKLSNSNSKFNTFINKFRIPVVTSLMGLDVIETNSELFIGRVGIYGDRAGNFAIQNSDLILALGCRLSQGLVGYNPDTFAREAKIIQIDIDESELHKDNVKCELKLHMNLHTFFDSYLFNTTDYSDWISICNRWKSKWLFEMPSNVLETSVINPYYALKLLFEKAPSNKNVVSMTGSIVTVLWHMINIKSGDKFIFNSQGDMGPELPASIGSYVAEPDKTIITVIGEGSLQFNIQELQTIVHHKMPIKILVFNNAAYGAIDITQRTYFKNRVGIDADTGLSFPDTKKIANAYGIEYISCSNNDELTDSFDLFLNSKNTIFLEVFCCIQGRYPKLSSVKNMDGSFKSLPFEDMAPLLERSEFYDEMIISTI